MKISIVIPVYYNQDNLRPLYADMSEKLLNRDEYEWEIVMVNDGSKDESYTVMKELAEKDKRIEVYSLSRNFGSHAAILCGLSKCTGDCAVVKDGPGSVYSPDQLHGPRATSPSRPPPGRRCAAALHGTH